MYRLRRGSLALATISLMSGCAAYSEAPRPQAYYEVSCDTPGAFRADFAPPPPNENPIPSGTDKSAAAPSQDGKSGVPATQSRCLLAVATGYVSSARRGHSYYGRGWGYPGPYFGSSYWPYSGSAWGPGYFGVGFGFGHYSAGFGHGSSHLGGHHGGHH